MIRVLIVDDSPSVCKALTFLINNQPGMQVVGSAADAFEAKQKVSALSPDVLTLDIDMPSVNGLVFLEQLMRTRPTPVVVISGQLAADAAFKRQAFAFGASSLVDKSLLKFDQPHETGGMLAKCILHAVAPRKTSRDFVAIGASTGGTEAVRQIVCALPAEFPPVAVVVHMPAGFTQSFAQRLNDLSKVNVKEAQQGEALLPGTVYIAPGDLHMNITGMGGRYTAQMSSSEKVSGHRPSVDELFASTAHAVGKKAIGVLLTGMGKDGAQGLLKMKQCDAYTVVQDESSSVVYGMPREGALLGAHCDQLPLDAIAGRLISETNSSYQP